MNVTSTSGGSPDPAAMVCLAEALGSGEGEIVSAQLTSLAERSAFFAEQMEVEEATHPSARA